MSTVDEEASPEYNALRRLEYVLNNKTESFQNKVESLIQVWKQVSQCHLTDHKQYVVHLMDWLKLHTLNIVLTGDWKKFKDVYEEKLLKEVKHCEMLLLHSNNIFSLRCRKLAEVIKDPWGSPILNRLLNEPEVVIGPQEIEFFCIETGYLISTRLRKLCESHCEDLALNLVSTFMRCHQMAEAQHFSLNATEDQKRFILDVYIALLYKYKRTTLIVSTLKSLTLKEGLELLKRFAHKRVNISKIWRHSNRIAHVAAQVYVTATVMKPPEESITILQSLLETWFSLNESTENLESLMSAIRRIVQAAETSTHMYIFCEAVHKKFGATMKTFIIELYIRALTTGMNELERQKNENDTQKIAETNHQLANGFLRLADVLEEHVNVSRECVLTSFSLQPTQETLDRIVGLARRSGYQVLDTGQNWKCKLHPPFEENDNDADIFWKCDACGDYMAQPKFETPINTNIALNEALTAEQLGLTSQLCDDLVVVLSSPRYQLFNWLLRWKDLHRLCVLYVNDPEGTKNLVTELKFLDIDYSIFVGVKREPEDEELTGIERGYEHYLEEDLYPEERHTSSEDSASQDSRSYSLGSDGMGENISLLPLPSSGKSDPDVLKSLRLFRPNLKRSKQMPLENSLPSKIFVTDTASPLSSANTTISTIQKKGSNTYVNPYSYSDTTGSSMFSESIPPYIKPQPVYSSSSVMQHGNNTFVNKYLNPAYSSSTNYSSSWPVNEQKQPENSSKEDNFLVLNSNTQYTPNSSSIVDNEEKSKPSIKQVFSEMEKALIYLKQHRNENISSRPTFDCTKEMDSQNLQYKQSETSTTKIVSESNPHNSERNITKSVDVSKGNVKLNPVVKIEKKSAIPSPYADFSRIMIRAKELSTLINPPKNVVQFEQTSSSLPNTSNQNVKADTSIPQEMSNPPVEPLYEDKNAISLPQKESLEPLLNSEINTNFKNDETQEDNLFSVDTVSQPKNSLVASSGPCAMKDPEISESLSTSESDLNKESHCLQLDTVNREVESKERVVQKEAVMDGPRVYLERHAACDLMNQAAVEMQLLKKFKIREARVILHRLSIEECFKKKVIKPASKFIKPSTPKRKQPNRKQKVVEKSENKRRGRPKKNKSKNGSKPWPLQDINPKVNDAKEISEPVFNKKSKCTNDFKTDPKIMNPFVVLKRLEFDKFKKRSANSILANVPGLNDLQMIRPSSVDRIVQVVQVPGVRNTTTNTSMQTTQTSTQVTPHIQRIGQPRIEKPEPILDSTSVSTTGTATLSTTTSTTSSESPTLINILSQQIIRPATQPNCVGVRPRSSPLINILSQQIIKPATASSSTKVVTSTNSEVNTIPRVISGGDQILNQLINPVRTPAPTLKTLVSAPTSDHNRIVQFICKSSDGKLIPVTSFTSNKVMKVSMTQTVPTTVAANTSSDENFKLTQTASKTKSEQIENSDTLPKFQQAFGKSAYQNNLESSECVTAGGDVTVDLEKSANVVKTQPKNLSTSLNVQPVQGGVIYTRQMPVGQTINLIPPGRGQVFRIAASNAEQLSLVKDTVIHGKMSALLAAALQGKQQQQQQQQARAADSEIDISTEENSQTNARVPVTTRSALVHNARIVKPVLQIPSNVIRSTPQSNLSSTTLEQLREFDMVYKQVKERSSTSVATESSPQSDSNEQPAQQISVTYLNQGQKMNCTPVVVVSSYCNVQPAASPSLSVTSQGSSSPCVTPAPSLTLSKTVTKSPKTKSVKSTTAHTTKASPIPKPQQKPQEDEHTTQRIFDILAEYAEQLRNSPDLNNKPAPRRRSNPPTNPNQNAKRKKSSSSKKTGHCSNSLASDGDIEDTHTVGSEDSSCGVVQISVQEEEQSLTAVSTTETSEASASPKQLILTDSAPNQSRSLIIADSNVGEALKMSNTAVLVPGNYIMPVSMVKGGQQIAVVSGGSKILATVPARSGPNMLLFQSFLNQTRKHGLPTVKYSTVQPISGIARNISTAQAPATVPTTQNLTAVTLAQTVSLQKVNQVERSDINNFDTELLLTIASSDNKGTAAEQQPQQRSDNNTQNVRVEDNVLSTESSLDKTFSAYEEKSLINVSAATSVIAQSINIKEKIAEEQPATTSTIMALNLNSSEGDKDTTIKVEGRVQSVLVATGTSNGPMLSHSPPTYNKQTDSTNSISETNKDEYLRNEGKVHTVFSHIDGQSLFFKRHPFAAVVAEDCIV